jgi:hypothetical protein
VAYKAGLEGNPAVDTPGIVNPPLTGESPTPSETSKAPGLPSLGGADLIAFLSDNDIWVMGVDGGNPQQITKDGAVKQNLQWAPDGQALFYIGGKCIQSISYPGGEVRQITCFNAAEYLDAFEILPDEPRLPSA